jgi:hypothetical protein
MPTLRAIRRSASAFDPHFTDKSPLFWPIAPLAHRFAHELDWPEVSTYARVFEGEPPVRFVLSEPLPRRHRRVPLDPAALYDARITGDGCVPTRPRLWHDFLNALVWGSFPRSKKVLHERQHEEIAAGLRPGATRLPGARSRDHDALALLDEGGVVLLDAPGKRVGVVFGHALYEGLVLGVRSMAARAIEASLDAAPEGLDGWVRAADEALWERLRAPGLVPEILPRIGLEEVLLP